MSRFTGLEKIEQRTAAAPEKAIVQLLKPYRPHALTITFDNGKEFTKHEGIARQLQTEVYFRRSILRIPMLLGNETLMKTQMALFASIFPRVLTSQ